jgi:hypothetical protein
VRLHDALHDHEAEANSYNVRSQHKIERAARDIVTGRTE